MSFFNKNTVLRQEEDENQGSAAARAERLAQGARSTANAFAGRGRTTPTQQAEAAQAAASERQREAKVGVGVAPGMGGLSGARRTAEVERPPETVADPRTGITAEQDVLEERRISEELAATEEDELVSTDTGPDPGRDPVEAVGRGPTVTTQVTGGVPGQLQEAEDLALAREAIAKENENIALAQRSGLEGMAMQGTLQFLQEATPQQEAEVRSILNETIAQRSAVDEAINVAKSNTVNPSAFWSSGDAAGNFAAALAVAVGQMSSQAGGGPNMAWNILNTAIERDIAAQEFNADHSLAIAKEEGQLLDRLRGIFGDTVTATQVARAMLFENLALELDTIGRFMNSPILAAQSQQVRAQAAQKGVQARIEGLQNITQTTTSKLNSAANVAQFLSASTSIGQQTGLQLQQQAGQVQAARRAPGAPAPAIAAQPSRPQQPQVTAPTPDQPAPGQPTPTPEQPTVDSPFVESLTASVRDRIKPVNQFTGADFSKRNPNRSRNATAAGVALVLEMEGQGLQAARIQDQWAQNFETVVGRAPSLTDAENALRASPVLRARFRNDRLNLAAATLMQPLPAERTLTVNGIEVIPLRNQQTEDFGALKPQQRNDVIDDLSDILSGVDVADELAADVEKLGGLGTFKATHSKGKGLTIIPTDPQAGPLASKIGVNMARLVNVAREEGGLGVITPGELPYARQLAGLPTGIDELLNFINEDGGVVLRNVFLQTKNRMIKSATKAFQNRGFTFPRAIEKER